MAIECALCFLEYTDGEDRHPACFPCGHVFCYACLVSLPEKSCPSCRWQPEAGPAANHDRHILKLFIPQLYEAHEQIPPQVQPRAEKPPLNAAGKKAALAISERLKALTVATKFATANAVIADARKWIENVESIDDTELRVAICRLLVALNSADRKLSENNTLYTVATQSQRQMANSQAATEHMRDLLSRSRQDLISAKTQNEDLEIQLTASRDRFRQAIITHTKTITKQQHDLTLASRDALKYESLQKGLQSGNQLLQHKLFTSEQELSTVTVKYDKLLVANRGLEHEVERLNSHLKAKLREAESNLRRHQEALHEALTKKEHYKSESEEIKQALADMSKKSNQYKATCEAGKVTNTMLRLQLERLQQQNAYPFRQDDNSASKLSKSTGIIPKDSRERVLAFVPTVIPPILPNRSYPVLKVDHSSTPDASGSSLKRSRNGSREDLPQIASSSKRQKANNPKPVYTPARYYTRSRVESAILPLDFLTS